MNEEEVDKSKSDDLEEYREIIPMMNTSESDEVVNHVTSDHIDLLLQTKHPVRHKDNNLSEDVKERKASLPGAQSESTTSTKVPECLQLHGLTMLILL